MTPQNVHNAIVGVVSLYGDVVEQITRENASLRAQNENLQKQLTMFTKAIEARDDQIAALKAPKPEPGTIGG